MLAPLYHQGSVTPSKDVVCDYFVSAILPSLTTASASTSASTFATAGATASASTGASTSKVWEMVSRGTINAGNVDHGSITVNVQNNGKGSVPSVQGVLVFYNRVFSASKYMMATLTPSSVVLSFKVPTAILDAHGSGPHPFYFSVHLEYKGTLTTTVTPIVTAVTPTVTPTVTPIVKGNVTSTPVSLQQERVLPGALLPPLKKVPIKKRKTNTVQGRFGNSYNYSHAVAMALEADRERQRHY